MVAPLIPQSRRWASADLAQHLSFGAILCKPLVMDTNKLEVLTHSLDD